MVYVFSYGLTGDDVPHLKYILFLCNKLRNMTIALLADDVLKKEWLAKPVNSEVEILWCGSVRTLVSTGADAYVDLLFTPDKERTKQLSMRSGFPFFINSVEYGTEAAGPEFIRINAWPGFLPRDIVEVALARPHQQVMVKEFFDKLGWNYQLVPDIPGMLTARIVASIINEAYFTFGDGTSSKKEIDIAMKLGTSYPYGPFEWSEKIGLGHIYSLLIELGKREKRYSVAPALEQEIRLLEEQ